MEKTLSKHVDRQATFDTDPRREHLAQGNIKLPVIEAREEERRKSAFKESKNKQVKIKSNPSIIEPRDSSTATTDKETKTHISAVNGSDSNRKSNILSHINKKVAITNSSEGFQEVKFSKDTNATVNVSSTSSKTSKSTDNTVKKITNHNNTTKSDDKSVTLNSKVTSEVGIKSGHVAVNSTNKGNALKNVDNQQTPGSSKTETSQKNDNRVTKTAHKGVKDSLSDNKPNERVNRSRSPENQQASKLSVLKDLNRKRSQSPVKDRNLSPQKDSKSNNQSGKAQVKQQTSKLVDTKSTQNNVSNVKSSDEKTVKTPRPLPRPTPRTKQETAKHISLSNQKKDNSSPTRKVDNKQSSSNTSKETTDKSIIAKRTIPANNAPAETHVLESEPKDITKEKNVKTSPRPKIQSKKQQPPVDSKNKHYDIKHAKTESEETTSRQSKTAANTSKENNSDVDISNSANGSHANSNQTNDPVPPVLKLSEANADKQPRNVSVDSKHITNNDQIAGEVQNSTNRVVNVQSKHETYVLSPSPTKYDPKSPVTHKVSRPSRLSPSNESVEPITLEPRPINDRNIMDIERRESYAQVYAERNTLLNAEYTYRKRIKQLEDEANGFLTAIDELTTENKYLRRRVDALEDELSGKGDLRGIERISDLEKDKIELENKVKQLQQNSKTNDNAGEIRELKEQVVQLQSENHKNNEENMKLKLENHEYTKTLQALEAEKKSRATSVTDVGSEKLDNYKLKDMSRQKQVNTQLSELNTKTQSLEKKVNALEYENKVLSETLVAKKSELNELLGVMKDENKFDDEIKELKNNVLKLNNEKKETDLSHNKEKRILNERLRESKSALEAKTKDVNELKIKLDQMDSEHKKMKLDFDPMKKLVESQKQEIARLTAENKLLKQELQDSKDLYTTLENETTNASNDLKEAREQLEQFNKELQKIVSDKESQINKQINQLDTIRTERENERKLAKDDKDNLVVEIEKVETYQSKAKRLEVDLKQLVEKHDESKLKEKQLTIQLEDESFHVSNLEQQVFELNMKMDTHSKRLSELDREKREIEKEKREWDVKKDKLDDIEASNKRLLEENKRLRNQIEMSSYQKDYRPPERSAEEKPIEAWVNENTHTSQAINHAIYVQKDKGIDRVRRKVHLAHVQSTIQKKRLPFSKSSPVKDSRHHRKEESKASNPSTHRSLEDLRTISDNRTPESEHSLPELKPDARLTMGYGTFGGYREIYKNRIRAAHKRVY